MDRNQIPQKHFKIKFLQIGDDPEATEFLRELGPELQTRYNCKVPFLLLVISAMAYKVSLRILWMLSHPIPTNGCSQRTRYSRSCWAQAWPVGTSRRQSVHWHQLLRLDYELLIVQH